MPRQLEVVEIYDLPDLPERLRHKLVGKNGKIRVRITGSWRSEAIIGAKRGVIEGIRVQLSPGEPDLEFRFRRPHEHPAFAGIRGMLGKLYASFNKRLSTQAERTRRPGGKLQRGRRVTPAEDLAETEEIIIHRLKKNLPLDKKQAAIYFHRSIKTIDRWRSDGKLEDVGGKAGVWITAESVLKARPL